MLRALLISVSFLALPAGADVPRVATDIAPVHGLAAMVMGDLGTPGLVLPQGASPHNHALRPSEAQILQDADLVFWIGPGLTPGLTRPLQTLAAGAEVIALSEAPGTHLLTMREEAVFGMKDAGHGHEEEHGHGHKEAQEDHGHEDLAHGHGHDESAAQGQGHDEAADDHGHDHGHAHAEGQADPHLWLDPENARLWLSEIAEHLARLDPENAATYRANADLAQAQIAVATEAAATKLAAAKAAPHVAFHDAYRYFEEAFGLNALGSIAISDATAPSPARLDALRDVLTGTQVACFVAEPQYSPGLIKAVSESTERPVIVADPMGADLALGAGFYPALIADLADKFAACASDD